MSKLREEINLEGGIKNMVNFLNDRELVELFEMLYHKTENRNHNYLINKDVDTKTLRANLTKIINEIT